MKAHVVSKDPERCSDIFDQLLVGVDHFSTDPKFFI